MREREKEDIPSRRALKCCIQCVKNKKFSMKKIVHLPNEHIKSMQRCRRAQVNFGCLEQDHRSSNDMTKNLKNLRIIDKKHSWSMYFTVMKKFKLVVQNFENRAPLQRLYYILWRTYRRLTMNMRASRAQYISEMLMKSGFSN